MGHGINALVAVVILLILVLVFLPQYRPWGDVDEPGEELYEEFGRGRGGFGGRGRGWGRGWGRRDRGWGRGRGWGRRDRGWGWGYGDINPIYYAEPTVVIESVTQEARDYKGDITITRLWADGRWTRSANGELEERGQISPARAGSILKFADSAEDTGGISYRNDGISYTVVILYSSGNTSRKYVGSSVIPDDIDT